MFGEQLRVVRDVWPAQTETGVWVVRRLGASGERSHRDHTSSAPFHTVSRGPRGGMWGGRNWTFSATNYNLFLCWPEITWDAKLFIILEFNSQQVTKCAAAGIALYFTATARIIYPWEFIFSLKLGITSILFRIYGTFCTFPHRHFRGLWRWGVCTVQYCVRSETWGGWRSILLWSSAHICPLRGAQCIGHVVILENGYSSQMLRILPLRSSQQQLHPLIRKAGHCTGNFKLGYICRNE